MASPGLLVDIGFSDADVEMARLLREYALHQSSPDAERLANLPHAHAGAAKLHGTHDLREAKALLRALKA